MTRHAPPPQRFLMETSAMCAILLRETDGEDFAAKIETSDCCTSAVNVFEMTFAISKQRSHSPRQAYDIVVTAMAAFRVEIVPFTPEMLPHAIAARERYARGRHKLNMGDCLSYAAAKQLGLTLIYKGDDFARTDVNG